MEGWPEAELSGSSHHTQHGGMQPVGDGAPGELFGQGLEDRGIRQQPGDLVRVLVCRELEEVAGYGLTEPRVRGHGPFGVCRLSHDLDALARDLVALVVDEVRGTPAGDFEQLPGKTGGRQGLEVVQLDRRALSLGGKRELLGRRDNGASGGRPRRQLTPRGVQNAFDPGESRSAPDIATWMCYPKCENARRDA